MSLGLVLDPTPSIAILRGHDPPAAVELAHRCWAAGIGLVEVPVQDERAWEALGAVVEAAGDQPVGAGTVLTPRQARRAADLGATVLISPGWSQELWSVTSTLGVTHVPGVFTPSEVSAAVGNGARTCKLFPASAFGTDYVRALMGPFPDVELIAVGGVRPDDAQPFLDAGAVAVAFGSSLPDLLANDAASFLRSLTIQARQRTSPRRPGP